MLRACLVVTLFAALNSQADAGGKVARGRALFERQWKTSEGLGPVFNARSCAACHFLCGAGGAGRNDANVDVLTVLRAGSIGLIDERLKSFASSAVLHARSTEDDYRRTRYKLLGLGHMLSSDMETLDNARWERVEKAEQRARQKSELPVINVKGGQLELSQRSTPALFGTGLIDKIPLQNIRRTTEALTRQFPHVSGRVVGRFGWRGQTRTLREFVVAACENELGLTAKDAKIEQHDPILHDQWDLGDDLVDFISVLPRPRQALPPGLASRNAVKQGQQLFHSAGCTACHVKKLGPVDGLYSDLALHDLGRRLADSATAPLSDHAGKQATFSYGSGPLSPGTSREVLEIAAREWKTPPLWGVADSAPYLHDGRAETLEDAILLHGGEARQSVAMYRQLGRDGQQRVIGFLQTLRAPKFSELEAVGQ